MWIENCVGLWCFREVIEIFGLFIVVVLWCINEKNLLGIGNLFIICWCISWSKICVFFGYLCCRMIFVVIFEVIKMCKYDIYGWLEVRLVSVFIVSGDGDLCMYRCVLFVLYCLMYVS